MYRTNNINETELVYSLLRESYPNNQIEISYNYNEKVYILNVTNKTYETDPEIPVDFYIKGGLKAEPTYDYIELVKYISWVVRKPNTNYNERILQANLLGQYGSIEVTTPSPTQPSTNVTTTPPSTQYPPIGRKGVEDEEEVLFNGELYWWIESLQQWRLQER